MKISIARRIRGSSDWPVVEFHVEKKEKKSRENQESVKYWPSVMVSWYAAEKIAHCMLNAIAPLGIIAAMSTAVFIVFIESKSDFLTNILPVVASAIVILPRLSLHYHDNYEYNVGPKKEKQTAKPKRYNQGQQKDSDLKQESRSRTPSVVVIHYTSSSTDIAPCSETKTDSPSLSAEIPPKATPQKRKPRSSPLARPQHPLEKVVSDPVRDCVGTGGKLGSVCFQQIDIATLTIVFLLLGLLLVCFPFLEPRIAGLACVWISLLLCTLASPLWFYTIQRRLHNLLSPPPDRRPIALYGQSRGPNCSADKIQSDDVDAAKWRSISEIAKNRNNWKLFDWQRR